MASTLGGYRRRSGLRTLGGRPRFRVVREDEPGSGRSGFHLQGCAGRRARDRADRSFHLQGCAGRRAGLGPIATPPWPSRLPRGASWRPRQKRAGRRPGRPPRPPSGLPLLGQRGAAGRAQRLAHRYEGAEHDEDRPFDDVVGLAQAERAGEQQDARAAPKNATATGSTLKGDKRHGGGEDGDGQVALTFLPMRRSRSASGRQRSSPSVSGMVVRSPCSTITSPGRNFTERSRCAMRSPLRLTASRLTSAAQLDCCPAELLDERRIRR